MKIIILSAIFISFTFSQTDSIDYTNKVEPLGYVFVENMPELFGGLDSLYQQIDYPKEALENDIEGKVYIAVIIDTNGVPHSPEVYKSIGFGCDEEAIRIILNSRFNPAYQRNKPVQIKMAVPVVFKLPK